MPQCLLLEAMILTQVQEGKFKYMNMTKPTGRYVYKRIVCLFTQLSAKHVGEGLIIIQGT